MIQFFLLCKNVLGKARTAKNKESNLEPMAWHHIPLTKICRNHQLHHIILIYICTVAAQSQQNKKNKIVSVECPFINHVALLKKIGQKMKK